MRLSQQPAAGPCGRLWYYRSPAGYSAQDALRREAHAHFGGAVQVNGGYMHTLCFARAVMPMEGPGSATPNDRKESRFTEIRQNPPRSRAVDIHCQFTRGPVIRQ